LVVCDELAKKGFKGVMGAARISIGGAGVYDGIFG